jgi:hypothetical protein
MIFDHFWVDGVRYDITPPLELHPAPDETGELLTAYDAFMDIYLFAPDTDALIEEVKEQLAFLWEEYACAPDDELTKAACLLKQRLLARIRPSKGEEK